MITKEQHIAQIKARQDAPATLLVSLNDEEAEYLTSALANINEKSKKHYALVAYHNEEERTHDMELRFIREIWLEKLMAKLLTPKSHNPRFKS